VRVLITGANGFVGPWLLREVNTHDPPDQVVAWVWGDPPGPVPSSRLEVREVDLRSAPAVAEAVADARPDVVFHLAAASSVAESWRDPGLSFEVNVLGTLHLLRAIAAAAPDAIVVAPTSGEIYGPSVGGGRHSEDAPPDPRSPYAVSKAAQDLLLAQVHHSDGLATVRMRPFVHTGPDRPERFAESSFAGQIAAIEAGRRPPRLAVGNLEAVRDVSDVRDVVRAYRLAADRRHAGRAFNVCRGGGVRMADLVERLLELSEVDIEVDVDPDRLRPSDLPELVGDPSRARSELGWRNEIPLERTLEELLDGWRQRLLRG
jgi:GDP-4-dehydro-6-deoxy-D-mannose reductase